MKHVATLLSITIERDGLPDTSYPDVAPDHAGSLSDYSQPGQGHNPYRILVFENKSDHAELFWSTAGWHTEAGDKRVVSSLKREAIARLKPGESHSVALVTAQLEPLTVSFWFGESNR